jgi:hypothetical protein
MSRKSDKKSVENPRHEEEATGTVLRLVPRAEREQQASPATGRSGTDHVQKAAWDRDDDDPGPTAA